MKNLVINFDAPKHENARLTAYITDGLIQICVRGLTPLFELDLNKPLSLVISKVKTPEAYLAEVSDRKDCTIGDLTLLDLECGATYENYLLDSTREAFYKARPELRGKSFYFSILQ